jgi:hypothetical protein
MRKRINWADKVAGLSEKKMKQRIVQHRYGPSLSYMEMDLTKAGDSFKGSNESRVLPNFFIHFKIKRINKLDDHTL